MSEHQPTTARLRQQIIARRLRHACAVGRLLGGHDTLSSVRDMKRVAAAESEAVTLEQIKHAAVMKAFRDGGSLIKAAARLDIKRQTAAEILKRNGMKTIQRGKIVLLASSAAVLLACVSFGQPLPFPVLLPKSLKANTNAAPVMSSVASPSVAALAAPEPPRNGSVKLAWNKSPDASVTGYRIYWGGMSGNYTNSSAVGNKTNATIAPLIEGVAYYFAATAYDANGTESPFSNEVKFSADVEGALRIFAWTYSNPGYFGKTNEIVTSTDGLKTWAVIKTFVGNGTAQSVVVTNTSAASFRVRIKP